LLGFVANSGCEFFRNGSWYDGKKAEAHLRYKYETLATRDRINTAEDFIEEARRPPPKAAYAASRIRSVWATMTW
jgi:hypothetical protein